MTRPTEDEIIERCFAPLAAPGGLGLRDDAALVTPPPGHDLVVTKDMLVAGVHFFADDPPDAIAQKALRVNLSDLAAKGARSAGFLLGLALPLDWTEAWLDAFAAGLGEDSDAFDCPLLGGDTVATPGPLTVSITALGEVETGRMVPRTGARPGDQLYVTGTIGDAALGLRLRLADVEDAGWIAALDAAGREALRDRYLYPTPRVAVAPALRHARAAMDVSDGFVGDLDKMLALVGLTAVIDVSDVPLSAAAREAIAADPRLIRAALTGGDDYELLCAVAPEETTAFESAARDARVPIARIGVALPSRHPIEVRTASGQVLDLGARRWEHFA